MTCGKLIQWVNWTGKISTGALLLVPGVHISSLGMILNVVTSAGGDTAPDFMWGFERDGEIIGRPVDIVGDGEGGYFVSDDFARRV